MTTNDDSELFEDLRVAGFPKYADMLQHSLEMETLFQISKDITRLAHSLGVVIRDVRTEGSAVSFKFGRCSPRHRHQFMNTLEHDYNVIEKQNRVVVSRV